MVAQDLYDWTKYLGSKSWQHDSYTELVHVRKTRLPNLKGSVGILLR